MQKQVGDFGMKGSTDKVSCMLHQDFGHGTEKAKIERAQKARG